MSLTLCITTPEGIVLAADSRQTYQNVVGAKRIGSDSATKIFAVDGKIGITVAGPAQLPDPTDKNGAIRGIEYYIQNLLAEIDEAATTESIAKKLKKGLEEIYNPASLLDKMEPEIEKQLHQIGAKIINKTRMPDNEAIVIDYTDKDGKATKAIGQIMPITLIVAGYDKPKGGKQELNSYLVHIPGQMKHDRQNGTPNQFGASWTGQTDVVHRTILGFDPRIKQIPMGEEAIKSLGEAKVTENLQSLEYIINWGAMNLYDAVDFANLMIEMTTAIQRFSDGIKLMPGDMPGVGGPIDIALIKPKDGFHWVQKKELKFLTDPEV